jgi:hypothetical protein
MLQARNENVTNKSPQANETLAFFGFSLAASAAA